MKTPAVDLWLVYNSILNIYKYFSVVNDSNVQFMEKSKDSSMGALYMALPFTRGQAFIVSVLDAILSLVNRGFM